jgi:lysophospholipid hydrolase
MAAAQQSAAFASLPGASSASPFISVSLGESLSAAAASLSASPEMTPRTLPSVPPPVDAMPGVVGRLLVFIFHTVPSLLFWVIGFATITVPTWLFTLFSMSLTFTMNFTTMYVM